MQRRHPELGQDLLLPNALLQRAQGQIGNVARGLRFHDRWRGIMGDTQTVPSRMTGADAVLDSNIIFYSGIQTKLKADPTDDATPAVAGLQPRVHNLGARVRIEHGTTTSSARERSSSYLRTDQYFVGHEPIATALAGIGAHGE